MRFSALVVFASIGCGTTGLEPMASIDDIAAGDISLDPGTELKFAPSSPQGQGSRVAGLRTWRVRRADPACRVTFAKAA